AYAVVTALLHRRLRSRPCFRASSARRCDRPQPRGSRMGTPRSMRPALRPCSSHRSPPSHTSHSLPGPDSRLQASPQALPLSHPDAYGRKPFHLTSRRPHVLPCPDTVACLQPACLQDPPGERRACTEYSHSVPPACPTPSRNRPEACKEGQVVGPRLAAAAR